MVKITLSLLSVAFVASLVSASPYRQERFELCPGVTVKEYQSFHLKSASLKSYISKELDSDYIVGGINGNKDIQELELCVVSTDGECNPSYPTSCIYENAPYLFRVIQPVQGYLSVDGNEVKIVPDFNEASYLNLYKGEANWALRVAYFDENNTPQVFSAETAGDAIVLEEVVSNKYSQWMEIEEVSDFKKKKAHYRFW
ncbi:hypothetical protein BG000_010963 [Podila horticola]|nr:hypothetical protein BG000_010963 [Podila horticola]